MIPLNVEIVADSISSRGYRITTFALEYPRYIHAQMMTHRMLSRNAQSSRAIPTKKLIERTNGVEHSVLPEQFYRNKKGMNPGEPLPEDLNTKAQFAWIDAKHSCVQAARRLVDLGVHKQWANRLLEPFTTIKALFTGTGKEWAHFFHLRDHGDAQAEIRILAGRMRDTYSKSEPKQVPIHAPYGDPEIWGNDLGLGISLRIRQAIARCARVSYLSFETGTFSDLDKDLKLYELLTESDPPHASPLEHVAFAMNDDQYHANFQGWQSYRNRKGW